MVADACDIPEQGSVGLVRWMTVHGVIEVVPYRSPEVPSLAASTCIL